MTDERLFPLDTIPEVPLLREPRRSRGEHDARFRNDYPLDWDRCQRCGGTGRLFVDGNMLKGECPDCLSVGSLKARARLEAGHRCERCKHPYMPKGDAKMLDREPSWRDGGWSACDDLCFHSGPMRAWTTEGWTDFDPTPEACGPAVHTIGRAEAIWRILTVHHLDGDKANCVWWNLAALCQRCHLEIQAKVVMERVYPHEHTEWFKPHAAGYYAKVYLDLDLSRFDVLSRLDELLGLERDRALT